MQNSTSGNQRTQGGVSSPPTGELELKKNDGEGSKPTATTTASVSRQGKRIKTEKEKAAHAERMRILRAKIKANDPSVPKKTAEYDKNRGKKRMEQFKAFLNGDRAKDKELERLRQSNKELEQQLARKEVENCELKKKTEEMETTLSVY